MSHSTTASIPACHHLPIKLRTSRCFAKLIQAKQTERIILRAHEEKFHNFRIPCAFNQQSYLLHKYFIGKCLQAVVTSGRT
jgi:hypothetical protein